MIQLHAFLNQYLLKAASFILCATRAKDSIATPHLLRLHGFLQHLRTVLLDSHEINRDLPLETSLVLLPAMDGTSFWII